MPRRGQRIKRRPIGDPFEPDGLGRAVADYLGWLATRNYSPTTIEGRSKNLRRLVEWLELRGVTKPTEVSAPMLAAYQRHLARSRTRSDRPLSPRSQALHLVSAKHFFSWMAKSRLAPFNAAADIELPRVPVTLPRATFSVAEAEAICCVPDTSTSMGLRDRAIIETFYATGIRRSELARLRLADADFSRRVLFIGLGKGARDRYVPMGERCAHHLGRYVTEARPDMAPIDDEGWLFLTHDGQSITPDRLTDLVRDVMAAAQVDKPGACHLFRHTMATLMLEGGADIRFIAEMLGHSSLKSTQIYTRVSVERLAKVHEATHPAALLEPRTSPEGIAADDASEALPPSVAFDPGETGVGPPRMRGS